MDPPRTKPALVQEVSNIERSEDNLFDGLPEVAGLLRVQFKPSKGICEPDEIKNETRRVRISFAFYDVHAEAGQYAGQGSE